MLNNYADNDTRRPEPNNARENSVIGVAVVIYNKKCTDSISFGSVVTFKQILFCLVDNSTDVEIQTWNRAECLRCGCDYISMDGNKGLAKAYNAAINHMGKQTEFLMLLDDDTVVPPDAITLLHNAIRQNPSADILVPFVYDQTALLSPNRRVNCLFFTFRKPPRSFTRNMSAINTGLVIRILMENGEKPVFDDKMFLDCIDHDFILKKIRQGAIIVLYPAEFRQNFFERASRKQVGMKDESRIRFERFVKDYRYFCTDCSLHIPVSEIYLFFRMLKLNIRFRTMDFGKVLRRTKNPKGRDKE